VAFALYWYTSKAPETACGQSSDLHGRQKKVDIQWIIDAIGSNRVRITDHADEEALADHLAFDEVFGSVFRGEIIEDYPDDWPYPSCLIYGETFRGDPVHSVWAYNEETRWAVLVTVYRPDPSHWIDRRERR